VANFVATCPSRKPHPALKYLQLERSSAILLDRPAHPFFDGLLRIYGHRLRSLFSLIVSRTALAAENLALRRNKLKSPDIFSPCEKNIIFGDTFVHPTHYS
jgi:hypothetical protein